MPRSTSEILAGLALPGGDSERQVGSAEININEAWRAFVRRFGEAADVARLVRGTSVPIGGPAVVTIGLETLLGIGAEGDATGPTSWVVSGPIPAEDRRYLIDWRVGAPENITELRIVGYQMAFPDGAAVDFSFAMNVRGTVPDTPFFWVDSAVISSVRVTPYNVAYYPSASRQWFKISAITQNIWLACLSSTVDRNTDCRVVFEGR